MKRAGMRAATFVSKYGIVLALFIELVVFSILSPHFLQAENQLNVLRQNAAIAVIAAGMTFVILTAGIDLSVGSIVAVSGVVIAKLLVQDWAPVGVRIPIACLVGIVAGAFCGGLNGLVVTKMKIPPFIATLAMMTIARGVALHMTDSRTISGLPDLFGDLDRGPIPVLVMLTVFAVGWILQTRTPFGRHVVAVGGNPEAARLCGIRVDRVLIKVYVLCGALAGLGGLMVAMRLNAGDHKAGTLFELDAIAAVVVGGTSLMGGRGSVLGTLVGVLVIGELNNGLNLVGVEYYSQKIVIGLVLSAAAFLDRFRQERSAGH